MKIYLIRHGKTPGNQLQRYIGITDEPVLEEDQERLKTQNYPNAEKLFVSPLLRCRQTAACIYPRQEQQVIQNLRECDFGRFENKNWKEMTGDAEYQAWVDSNATLPFPGGEDPQEFRDRPMLTTIPSFKVDSMSLFPSKLFTSSASQSDPLNTSMSLLLSSSFIMV